jgi:hypothetical protein
MKVLFCTFGFVDYGLDVLYDGLCRALGHENVHDYPHKSTLHEESPLGRKNSYVWYPCFFNYPVAASDSDKIELLRSGGYDLLILACRGSRDFTFTRYPTDPQVRHADLIARMTRHIPTVLVDYADSEVVNEALIDRFNALLYFKREYMKGTRYGKRVRPLPLAYSPQFIAPVQDDERYNMVFWAGKRYRWRGPFLEACEHFQQQKFNKYWPQPLYAQALARHIFGLSLPGHGQDTARYYEVPANGALLFSQRLNVVIPYDFTDLENAVFFDDPNEMVGLLDFYTRHAQDVDMMRSAGTEHYKQYHTSEARAGQLLRQVEAAL